MLNAGKTTPVCLYDLACKLADAVNPVTIDPSCELYRALCDALNSAWGQLPDKIVIDFTDD